LVQWTLFACPQPGRSAALTFVSCLHSPSGPAHTSGGCSKECRTTADIWPSRDRERPTPPVLEIVSAPVQSVLTDLSERSSVATPAPPSTDRKSTRLNSSHSQISYAVFCL